MKSTALLVWLIAILSCQLSLAQPTWIESNEGLEGGTVHSFASRDGDDAELYAAASDGVYRFDRAAQ
jgi:hypothetical protein